MFRLESSAARAATINPPSTERNGSLSAAVPTLCQASVPFKNDTIICAESCIAESILAIPFAFPGHRPKSETDSAAVDVAIRNHARAARQIKPQRRAGKRHHAVVESSRVAGAPAAGVARGGHRVHSAQIVRCPRSRCPGRTETRCRWPFRQLESMTPNSEAIPVPKFGVARKTALRTCVAAGG